MPSLFGSRYFFTFTDDYNRKTWVQFLKKKLDTLSTFKNFKNKVQKEIGKKINFFRSNNGEEYINRDFINFCKYNIVKRQFSQHGPTQTKWGCEKEGLDIRFRFS